MKRFQVFLHQEFTVRPMKTCLAQLFLLSIAATPATAQSASTELPQQVPAPQLLERPAPPSSLPSTPVDPPLDPAQPRWDLALPDEERQCRAALDSLGADYVEAQLSDLPENCAIEHPVTLRELGSGVLLDPPATLGCRMAEATARFFANHVQAEANEAFGQNITAVRQMSGHVCRPRAGTSRMSEHATGNALDWGSFVLTDGTEISVEAHPPGDSEQAFLNAVRDAACGPFTTVLGPGSDADHADHFHMDLAERREPLCP